MMVRTQPGSESKHVRLACSAQALMSRYRASGVLAHAVNFAGGVFVGCIIVLFVLLTLG
jgi:hypothetical protein